MYNVRLVQSFHVESRGWNDIGYNYLVGGEGSAYYGRGWDYVGAHTLGYNKYSIGIAFIGTFTKEAPPQKQLDACKKLIKRGVALGKIAKDYKLFAHRQLMSTESPGEKLFEILQEWPHFVKDVNLTNIIPNYWNVMTSLFTFNARIYSAACFKDATKQCLKVLLAF